jgi:dolichol kinase
LYVFSPSLAQIIGILLYLIFVCWHGYAVCRLAWQALGDASQDEAMAGFIELLDKLCPLFTPFVEAHKRDLEERERVA